MGIRLIFPEINSININKLEGEIKIRSESVVKRGF